MQTVCNTMGHFGVFPLLLLLWSAFQAAGEVTVFHIMHSTAELCPQSPCFTDFAANYSKDLTSNATLILAPGNHYLSVNLTLSNLVMFTMISNRSTARVVCINYSFFSFDHCQSVHITNVEFLGCGGNTFESVKDSILWNTMFKGQDNSGRALVLVETAVQITDSFFLSSAKGTLHSIEEAIDHDLQIISNSMWVGGAVIATLSNITIKHSLFENNRAQVGGALYLNLSSATIDNTTFIDNHGSEGFRECSNGNCHENITFAGVLYQEESHVTITNSHFSNNSASYGGAIFSVSGTLSVLNGSKFSSNIARRDGGALYSQTTDTTIDGSVFIGNIASLNGGALYSLTTSTAIDGSIFVSNVANHDGGALYILLSSTTIDRNSQLTSNSASSGGALYSASSSIAIYWSQFNSNTANKYGGALFLKSSSVTINRSQLTSNTADCYSGGALFSWWSNVTLSGPETLFTKNIANTRGAVMAAFNGTINSYESLLIDSNSAKVNAVLYLVGCTVAFSGSARVTNNLGSILAVNSNVTFEANAVFRNNFIWPNQTANIHEGGAITLYLSSALLSGTCTFEGNYAKNGGAVHLFESKLYVYGGVKLLNNRASHNGGGIFLYQSELNIDQVAPLYIFIGNNTAVQKGGGIHAAGSVVKLTQFASMVISSNSAEKGGGISLESDAKLYIYIHTNRNSNYLENDRRTKLNFTGNSAEYGGAVYVDDHTYSTTCTSQTTQCFFQVLSLHRIVSSISNKTDILFEGNYASISGSTLFGGLIHRCTVNPLAEIANVRKPNMLNGVSYLDRISIHDQTLNSITSYPVRVCHCINDLQNCTFRQHSPYKVEKGKIFRLSVAAVDQIGNPVNATIQSILSSKRSGLAEGLIQAIPGKCTELNFSIISPSDSEKLTIHASNSPCSDDLSKLTVKVTFLPCTCPNGFQPSNNSNFNCSCECHHDIAQYVSKCDIETESIVRKANTWISNISYENSTIEYLVYPNCPYVYCNSNKRLSVQVNLNQLNGADAQCNSNRSGLLCGSCKPGLSLSLGSSRCLICPSYWPALLVIITLAAALAGVALVAGLLMLNMTVAVGTLNGLIFYANILAANRSILLPFSEPNFVTVFVSWLNLEFGIDSCYFKGLDAYTKTWFQLAFPAYVLSLVVLVMLACSYSSKFSNLIGKRNPVATLATLILLSYAEILEVVFKALTSGTLTYPNNTTTVWLPDARVRYFAGKHIPLFTVAFIILHVGLVYTAILFSWQWLLKLPSWWVLKWTKNQKLHAFVVSYHVPYTSKHRYWTGLLLLARAILYLTAAANVSNDPQLALMMIILIVGSIVILKSLIGSRLYRQWPVDTLETFFYLNILAVATLTWYTIDKGKGDIYNTAIAYTSVVTTCLLLLVIILYHMSTYTSMFSKIYKTKFGQNLNFGNICKIAAEQKAKAKYPSPPLDKNSNRYIEYLYCFDNADYQPSLKLTPLEPIHSVLENRQPEDFAYSYRNHARL